MYEVAGLLPRPMMVFVSVCVPSVTNWGFVGVTVLVSVVVDFDFFEILVSQYFGFYVFLC